MLDTGPAQKFVNKDPVVSRIARDRRTHGDVIGICVPVLGELWSGVEGSESRELNASRLRNQLSKLVLWPYDKPAAREFGRLFNVLKKLGRPMQQIDIQIAASALSLGNCIVVTTDSDLSAIPGLSIENWQEPPKP